MLMNVQYIEQFNDLDSYNSNTSCNADLVGNERKLLIRGQIAEIYKKYNGKTHKSWVHELLMQRVKIRTRNGTARKKTS